MAREAEAAGAGGACAVDAISAGELDPATGLAAELDPAIGLAAELDNSHPLPDMNKNGHSNTATRERRRMLSLPGPSSGVVS